MSRPFKRASLAFAVALGLLLLCAGAASAHKVSVFAYAEGGRVFTESYYVDGSKVANSPIEVFDSTGKVLLSGRTDDAGQFSFTPPAGVKGGLRIVVTASMGHKAETVLAASELPVTARTEVSKPKAEPSEPRRIEAKSAPKAHNPAPTAQPARSVLTQEELAQIRQTVAQELDARLTPLARQLASMSQDRITMTDIVGGLGYIAGLLGVVFFMKGRGR
jgi:nickel transport protein